MFERLHCASEEAVEYGELDTFLRLKESWNPDLDDTPTLPVQPVGVPGAASPSQMTNHKPSFAPTPSPLKDKSKQEKERDAGDLLGDKGLEGIAVTDEELADLVRELGLEGDDAGDLIKGLSGPVGAPEPETTKKEESTEKLVVTEQTSQPSELDSKVKEVSAEEEKPAA